MHTLDEIFAEAEAQFAQDSKLQSTLTIVGFVVGAVICQVVGTKVMANMISRRVVKGLKA